MDNLAILLEYGYFVGLRTEQNPLYPPWLKERVTTFTSRYIIFDPLGDADSWCLVGNDLPQLLKEAVLGLERHRPGNPIEISKGFEHLRWAVYFQLRLWNSSDAAERALGCDIDTRSHVFDDLCGNVAKEEDALSLPPEDLLPLIPEDVRDDYR